MGAMYLDLGFEEVKRFIYKNIIPLIENNSIDFIEDYKSVLQELVQTDRKSLTYEVVDESGPAHDKTFKIVVKIEDIIYGEGTAHSKKEAEQEAAKNALDNVDSALSMGKDSEEVDERLQEARTALQEAQKAYKTIA